jgi:glutathione peroxidase-family protein
MKSMQNVSLRAWAVLAGGVFVAVSMAVADDAKAPQAPTPTAGKATAAPENASARLEVFGIEVLGTNQAMIGKAAPLFTLKDAAGKDVSLASLKDKYVVLEWINFGCPFVKKHYGSGNMQKLQTEYAAKGVVWLTICSSARGKDGFFEGDGLSTAIADAKWQGTSYLVDADGTVGKLYGAKTTPHMFVIDPKGMIVYAGAIDDKRSANPADIEGAINYVRAALDAAMAGKTIEVATTQSYGCSVKYAS